MSGNNTELTFRTWSDAVTVAKILMQNDYVVMLSCEEELTILNAVWSKGCDRNEVIFMSKDYFYENDEDETDGN